MKLHKSSLSALLAATSLALCMTPSVSWSTRAFGGGVTGEITAPPSSGEIEVGSHPYHIKAKSAAEQTITKFYMGQNVHLILDGPPGNSKSQVIAITLLQAP